MTDDFDFGFSAVTEEELDIYQDVQKKADQVEQQLKEVDNKALKLYNAIIPLLDNLRKNPEKEIIRWPNREEKIDAFEAKLSRILDGDE